MTRYRPGDLIPTCAMYLVKHESHLGTRIVVGAAGDIFPQCRTCRAAVAYELLNLYEYSTAEVLADHPEFAFPALKRDPKSA